MQSLEQEFKTFLKSRNVKFTDNCESYKLLDFTLNNFSNGKDFHIDVKEKRQKINTKNWPTITETDEEHTFIIDELAARKIIAYAPHAGLIIRDNIYERFYWFSILDLALMPKYRLNRSIQKSTLQQKGKWVIDLRNAAKSKSLSDVFVSIEKYCTDIVTLCTEYLPCYGTYHAENIAQGGATRKPGHWDVDVKETR